MDFQSGVYKLTIIVGGTLPENATQTTLPLLKGTLLRVPPGNATEGRQIPFSPTSDNYFVPPTSNLGTWEFFNAAGVQQWIVTMANVSAAADFWTGVQWLDDAGDRLYVQTQDTALNEMQLAFITISTGVVSLVGTLQSNTNLTSWASADFTRRSAIGSGDFELFDNSLNKFTVNETTGAITESLNHFVNTPLGYITKDENWSCSGQSTSADFGIGYDNISFRNLNSVGGNRIFQSTNIEDLRLITGAIFPKIWGTSGIIFTSMFLTADHIAGTPRGYDPDLFDAHVILARTGVVI